MLSFPLLRTGPFPGFMPHLPFFLVLHPLILAMTCCVGKRWSLVNSPLGTQWKVITVPYPESIHCPQFSWEGEGPMSPSPSMIGG